MKNTILFFLLLCFVAGCNVTKPCQCPETKILLIEKPDSRFIEFDPGWQMIRPVLIDTGASWGMPNQLHLNLFLDSPVNLLIKPFLKDSL